MPRSVTSVFSEAKDFEAALRPEGVLRLFVTGPGAFRARLTQVALHRLRLSATDERLPRIATVVVPADIILVSLSSVREPAPIWGGARLSANEIMTLGPGRHLHMRADGSCRSRSIWVPALELVRYRSALTGAALAVPSVAQWWRVQLAMIRHLRHLHSAAIDLVERRWRAVIDGAAAHGLEQQLMHALVDCLSNGSVIHAACPTRAHQDVAVRFEALLQTQPERALRTAEICSALGISARTFRLSCEEQLGMGPAEYARRRRMQPVHIA